MSKWQWILKQFCGKLWVRSSLFCVLAVLTALFALLVKGYIPEDVSRQVGAEAVDGILQIIASSMLAVTIFSLSTMVAAYSAATSNVTPRSTQLLLQDSTAQNALSVFIGAFLYSLVGIIALSMEIYGDSGRLVLFVVTLLVIAIIIGVLLQWINYLSRLGRVGETIDMVERATLKALKQRMETPYLGGSALAEYKPRRNHHPVCCGQIGYVQNIDVPALSRLAETLEAEFYLRRLPGAFNDGVQPLLYSSAKLDEQAVQAACGAFSIGDSRSFEQDPRFGMVVLGEIASRALSAAINDSGTAIDIIGTTVRTLAPWVTHDEPAQEPLYPNVHVPPLKTADMFEDLFVSFLRDGAGLVEVGVRLQKAFASLSGMGNADAKREARRFSQRALEYAGQRLTLESEKETLRALAELVPDVS